MATRLYPPLINGTIPAFYGATLVVPFSFNRAVSVSDVAKMVLKINGMMCPHCESTVKTALESIDGVTSAEVSHESGTAVVTLSKEVSDDVLKKAVVDKGYTVE